MKPSLIPDLSLRPSRLVVERETSSLAAELYEAWTKRFDLWFAEPYEILMMPELNRPFFFYNRHEWGRHAHYGRFLKLETDRLVEMTWVSGKDGTFGAETVLRIELSPKERGTLLRLTHWGFEDANSCREHELAWPIALDALEAGLEKERTKTATDAVFRAIISRVSKDK